MLLLDGRILAYRRGGIARYVASLADHLPAVAPDLSVHLIINRPIPAPGWPTRRVRTPPHHRWERWALGLELLRFRPRLVHSPDFIPPILPGVPRVITVHDLAFLADPSLLAPDALRYYGQLPRVIAAARAVIAVSHAVRQQVVERLRVPPERVAVVYNGVGPEFFAEPDAATLAADLPAPVRARLSPDRALILVVGTVEPRKRHALIAQAVEHLAARRPDLAPLLVVAGQPGWRSAAGVAAIQRLAQAGHAVWLTDVSDGALRALYATATLLALPSRDEGFGLPLAEAMAAGLPCVVARRGALPEVGGDAAMYVEEDDPATWADVLEAVLDDATLRHTLAARGKQRATRFRWEETARATAAIYRGVLAGD
ncbi:MAG: glycosyltransferase family 1 protein [Sphaerobacter sp.]|nr:glycosyltransferase family 1 protein [Sphaerobacter sp.]